MQSFLQRILATRNCAATLLRVSVGSIFLPEGIQKFLFPAAHYGGPAPRPLEVRKAPES